MVDIGYDLSRVNGAYYEVLSNRFTLREEAEDGAAELEIYFTAQADKQYIRLLKEHDHILTYTENRKCADGIILEWNLVGSCNRGAKVYIIELKTGIGVNTWKKVKKQFQGATFRALAFASTIGVGPVEQIYYFTAFTEDRQMKKSQDMLEKQKRITGIAASKRLWV
ncbi:hypothetical protein [Paenibacillus sp. KS-LC4]|uniref:hypothetical protein n=1 Tax=Paenibacillus sp. KS-LC4 TaxID=2979727 RepID=UPI0030CFFA93